MNLLHLPQLAIVGSRKATIAGTDLAKRFASELSRSGFCITSGLASGVDSYAHEGALCASARTIAVMETGPDLIYPAINRDLARRIVELGGCLVTEFLPGTAPRPQNFPQRNRIISGLSLGTLVVEASERSGSLITARLAMEQGREVFALPGSVNSTQSRGCHRLIKQGATLVETASDIVEQLSSLLGYLAATNENGSPESGSRNTSSKENELLGLLGYDPVTLDTLVERSGWSISSVQDQIVELELQGLISSDGEFYQRLA